MRYRTTTRRGLALAAVLAFTIVACGGNDTAPSDPAAPAAPAAPGDDAPVDDGVGGPAVDADTIVIATAAEISSPNLQRYTNISPDINVTNLFWDTLVRRGRDGLPEAWLATEWLSNDDATEWTIKLRDDVIFHDGTPMTAEVIVYNLLLMANADFGAPITQYWKSIVEHEIINEFEVKFTLASPDSLFMHAATRAPILSQAYHEQVGDEAATQAPVTSAAYRLVSWTPDDRLVLERFDEWWGWNGDLGVKNIIVRPITETAARVSALLAGEVDIAVNLPVDFFPVVESGEGVDIRITESIERQFLFFDVTRPPFDDVRVRQAVNYAIDKQVLIDTLLPGGVAEQIPAMSTPLEPGHDPNLKPYPYDPDRARALLAEAGYADGLTVGYTVRTGYIKGPEVAEAIAGYLAAVGIRTETRLASPADYSTLHKEKTITELGYSGWGGGGQFMGNHYYNVAVKCEGGSSIWSGYWCNEEMDALIAESIRVFGPNQARGIAAIQEAEAIYHELAGAGFLFVNNSAYAAKSRLVWDPHPDAGLYGERMRWR